MQLAFKVLSRQSGATMVELAMVIPVVALIMAGIIEFGIAARRGETLSEAAREAARSAAIVSFEDDVDSANPGLPCYDTGAPERCEQGPSWETCSDLESPTSLPCYAYAQALGFLSIAGLDSQKYSVRVRSCDLEPVVGDPLLAAVQVEIELSPDAESCIFCFHRLAFGGLQRARATFAVEGTC